VKGLQVRRKRDDRADVQVAVRPAVEALADAGSEGVVDVRMAERALDAHRLDAAGLVELAGHADHGIELEQREGRGGIVEVDLAGLDSRDQLGGQGLRVHFQPDRQRGLGADAAADAAVFSPAMAWCSCRASPQKASEPKVSKRKIRMPSSIVRCACARTWRSFSVSGLRAACAARRPFPW
jgi:hypothetical protein